MAFKAIKRTFVTASVAAVLPVIASAAGRSLWVASDETIQKQDKISWAIRGIGRDSLAYGRSLRDTVALGVNCASIALDKGMAFQDKTAGSEGCSTALQEWRRDMEATIQRHRAPDLS